MAGRTCSCEGPPTAGKRSSQPPPQGLRKKSFAGVGGCIFSVDETVNSILASSRAPMQTLNTASMRLTSVAEVSRDVSLRSRQRKLINLKGPRQLRDRIAERHGTKRVADWSCWRQSNAIHKPLIDDRKLTHSYKLWSSSLSTSMAIDIPSVACRSWRSARRH